MNDYEVLEDLEGENSPFDPECNPDFTQPYHKVEVRTQQWKERVDKRLQEVRNSKKDKELEGCTFHPMLISNHPKMEGLQTKSKKSYDKYIRRMEHIRNTKEIKIQEEQMKPGSGMIL